METLQEMVHDLRDRLEAAEAKIEDLIRPVAVTQTPKVADTASISSKVATPDAPPFTPPNAPPSAPVVDTETEDHPTGV